MMRDYFEAEMRLLHEAAQEFAAAYPEQARMLNLGELRDRDPYIERLLEGVAFLSAQIRGRIDASQIAVSEQLLAHVCANQLRPYPSTTVVEFAPEAYRQACQPLEPGLELLSEPVGEAGVSCRFRTTRPLLLQPLMLDQLAVEEQAGSLLRITLGLRYQGSGDIKELDLRSLPLFLHADYPLAVALYQALTDGVEQVRLHFPGSNRYLQLGAQERLRPMHLEPGAGLLPDVAQALPGLELLQDYFSCRDKYLFVELRGPETLEWPAKCRRFEIQIDCRATLPAEHKLSRENLRLHAVPAVNLFRSEAEPVTVDHRQAEYRLLADARFPREVSIYSVDRVQGRELRSGKVHEYRPLYALRRREAGERYYHVSRRDLGGALPQTYLLLGGEGGLERESLSCEVTCCNGHLPRQYLHERQLCKPGRGVPSGVRFANLTRPSDLRAPPAGADYPRRLHSLLALGVGSLARTESLRGLLELFNWSGRRDARKRIDAIRRVAAEPFSRFHQGALYSGLELTLEVEEAGFASPADVYLLGQVLQRFFAQSAAVNEFVCTRVVCLPSHKEYRWQARLGQSSPI